MKIVADESVEGAVSARLQNDGHEVVAIAVASPSLPDNEVLAFAVQRESLLVTAD